MKLLSKKTIIFIVFNFFMISTELGMNKEIICDLYKGNYNTLYSIWKNNNKKLTPQEQLHFLLSIKLRDDKKGSSKGKELLAYIKEQKECSDMFKNANTYCALVTNLPCKNSNRDILNDVNYEVFFAAEKSCYNFAEYVLNVHQVSVLGLVNHQINNVIPFFKKHLGNNSDKEKIKSLFDTLTYALSIVFWQLMIADGVHMRVDTSVEQINKVLAKSGWLSEIVEEAGVDKFKLPCFPKKILEFVALQDKDYWGDWISFIKRYIYINNILFDEALEIIEKYEKNASSKNIKTKKILKLSKEEDFESNDLKEVIMQELMQERKKYIYQFCQKFTKVDDKDTLE